MSRFKKRVPLFEEYLGLQSLPPSYMPKSEEIHRKYWAVFSHYYFNFFEKTDGLEELKKIYYELINDADTREEMGAIRFFYRWRYKEILEPKVK